MSRSFPPQPAPPQTLAVQASDEKAFFMSQSETHEAHTTGLRDTGAGAGEGADMHGQRQPSLGRQLPDLVSKQPWTQLGALGPTHGAST